MKKTLPFKLSIAKRLRNKSNYLLKMNGYIKSLKWYASTMTCLNNLKKKT
jgi:hypothetical protein